VAGKFWQSRSVKVDWLKLRRKLLYYFAIFAIINEKLIKEDRPMRVARSTQRRRRSDCNIMVACGEAVIGEGRSLRYALTHSSLLPSPITASPRAAIMLQSDRLRRRVLLATRIGRSSLINFSLIIANITKQYKSFLLNLS